MFETAQFRTGIEERLQAAVREFHLRRYAPSIPDTLQFLAIAHEEVLIAAEQSKPPTQRRGTSEAFASASTLAMGAGRIAAARKSLDLEMVDIARSYAMQFCRVWPFCR